MADFPLPSNLAQVKRVTGAQPAGGAEFTQTVPAGKWWILLSVYVQLTQGATQTPQPILFIDDGVTTLLESIGSTAAQAANTTVAYNWAPGMILTGLTGTGANVHANAPIPDGMLLLPGWRIRSSTVGIGANSAYQTPSFYVAELG
jgi:hypothetical protein